MKKASRILSFLGIGFGYALGIGLVILAIMGYMGAFKLVPAFMKDERILFDTVILFYGLFAIVEGFFSLHHYIYEGRNQRDMVYEWYYIIGGILTLNIFAILAGSFSLVIIKRGY